MSVRTSFNELLESGAHFGHLKSKWNPAMAPYIPKKTVFILLI